MSDTLIFTTVNGITICTRVPGRLVSSWPRELFEGGNGPCHGIISDAYEAMITCENCSDKNCTTKNGDKPCRWAAHRKAGND